MTTITTAHSPRPVDETEPRAWVGCLGCYNAGRIVGRWLDANETQDLTSAGLTDEDDLCVMCGAEEFWCFDVENVGRAEEMSPADFVERAEMEMRVDEHADSDALRAFLEDQHLRGTAEDLSNFEDRYMGTYDSRADWAHQYIEDVGLLNQVPESLRYYIDADAFARDAELNGGIDFVDDSTGGVYVFSA